MIPRGVDIYLGVEPIDLRWGFDRLCGIVQERVGRRPRSGAIFVFFGRRKHAMKALYFDGTGLCLFYTDRQNAGRPPIHIVMTIASAQVTWPLDGRRIADRAG